MNTNAGNENNRKRTQVVKIAIGIVLILFVLFFIRYADYDNSKTSTHREQLNSTEWMYDFVNDRKQLDKAMVNLDEAFNHSPIYGSMQREDIRNLALDEMDAACAEIKADVFPEEYQSVKDEIDAAMDDFTTSTSLLRRDISYDDDSALTEANDYWHRAFAHYNKAIQGL